MFIETFDYVGDCLEFRRSAWSANVPLPADDWRRALLVSSTRRVLSALSRPEFFAFHAEFWITASGEAVFCEIASRTAGGIINEVTLASTGVDMDRSW